MGNQAAAMKNFAYEIGEPYAETYLWRLHNGKKKLTQERVTIFSCEITNLNRDRLELVRTSFKRMKAIRHPNFIKYLDGVELQTHIYVVTEYVHPLSGDMLREMRTEVGCDEAISWGLFQVSQGLEFLHSRRMYHGNVSLQSIYVDDSGDWKIGQLGFLSEIGSSGGGGAMVDSQDPSSQYASTSPHGIADFSMRIFQAFLIQKYKAPEVLGQRWDLVERYPDRVDSWGVACLIYELFEGELSGANDLRRVTSKIPKSIAHHYNQLLIDDPAVRMALSDFLQSSYFNNSMIKTQQFLDTLNLKDPVAVDSFLTQLPESLNTFPRKCCKYRVLPQLVNTIKFGSGGSKAIIPIFMIGEMMSTEEFKESFIPKIIELFESTDRTVRVNLLKNLKMIMPHLSVEVIEQKIYPNVEYGFKDSSPVIREATVKSMIDLVPKLTEHTVSENVVKHLWSLQGDKEPAIRTNTVIALGKLSKNFNQKTQKQVLIAAFARSLKDPFVPSRMASLRALMSTKDLYSPADLAQKALPAVVALTVDVDKGVRDLAFQCVNNFLELVRQVSESPNFNELVGYDVPKVQQAASDKAQPSTANGPTQSKQMDEEGSYLGWAVSSVSSIKSKIVGEKGHIGADIKKPLSPNPPTNAPSNPSTTKVSMPVQSQPQQPSNPMLNPTKSSGGLKLTHDTPKKDIFANMQIKAPQSTLDKNDPFGDDMFADMSFKSDSTHGNGSYGTQSAAPFAPRASKSNGTPTTPNNNKGVNNKNNLADDFSFGDWDSNMSNNNKVDSFFDDVMNNDDVFGLNKSKSTTKPMKPTKSVQQPKTSTTSGNSSALKFERPKSDTPSRARPTTTTKTANNTAQQQKPATKQPQQKKDEWEDWSWDDMK